LARTGKLPNPLGRGVAGYYGVRQDVVDEIRQFERSQGIDQDPFAQLPQPSPKGLQARSGAFIEGYSVFNDMTGTPVNNTKYDIDASKFGYDTTAGTYYEGMSPTGSRYQNLAGQTIGSGPAMDRTDGPAPLTIRPTSTSDINRPRTVAAGWEAYPDNPRLGKLTVVFRDGTYYNYYDVTDSEWSTFSLSSTKGPLLNQHQTPGYVNYLYNKPRGEAALGFLSESAMETRYRTLRASQLVYQEDSANRKTFPASRQNIKSGRAGRPRKANSSTLGTNPATKRKKP
jgi:hypothetical protein